MQRNGSQVVLTPVSSPWCPIASVTADKTSVLFITNRFLLPLSADDRHYDISEAKSRNGWSDHAARVVRGRRWSTRRSCEWTSKQVHVAQRQSGTRGSRRKSNRDPTDWLTDRGSVVAWCLTTRAWPHIGVHDVRLRLPQNNCHGAQCCYDHIRVVRDVIHSEAVVGMAERFQYSANKATRWLGARQ